LPRNSQTLPRSRAGPCRPRTTAARRHGRPLDPPDAPPVPRRSGTLRTSSRSRTAFASGFRPSPPVTVTHSAVGSRRNQVTCAWVVASRRCISTSAVASSSRPPSTASTCDSRRWRAGRSDDTRLGRIPGLRISPPPHISRARVSIIRYSSHVRASGRKCGDGHLGRIPTGGAERRGRSRLLHSSRARTGEHIPGPNRTFRDGVDRPEPGMGGRPRHRVRPRRARRARTAGRPPPGEVPLRRRAGTNRCLRRGSKAATRLDLSHQFPSPVHELEGGECLLGSQMREDDGETAAVPVEDGCSSISSPGVPAGEIGDDDLGHKARGLDIGTSKRPRRNGGLFPSSSRHLRPDGDILRFEFVRRAKELVGEIQARGRLPILVGGTGLYLAPFSRGTSRGRGRPCRPGAPARRGRTHGAAALHTRLRTVEPSRQVRFGPGMCSASSEPSNCGSRRGNVLDARPALWDPPRCPSPHFSSLCANVRSCYRMIDTPARLMWEGGWNGRSPGTAASRVLVGPRALQALGLSAGAGGARRAAHEATALVEMQRATRNYAKRQVTCFRREPTAEWVTVTGGEWAEPLAKAVLDRLEGSEGSGSARGTGGASGGSRGRAMSGRAAGRSWVYTAPPCCVVVCEFRG